MSSSSSAALSGDTSSSSHFLDAFSGLALGYAIAVATVLLLSALLLFIYLYYRSRFTHTRNPNPNPNSSDGLMLPRIIFIAEDDDDGRHSPLPGLDPAVVSSYPKFPFSAGKGWDTVCSICLCDYREGEMLRMMPDCRHYFHLMCIDAWLRINASCPVCRTSPMPTPLSTPLSELVPLSQFPAGRRRS